MTEDSSYVKLLGHRVHRAWVIMIGCCFLSGGSLGALLGVAGVFTVPVCTELGFARSEFPMWISAYFISMIFAMPFAGDFIKRFNARIVMSVCCVACAVAAAMMGTYTELWQFIASGLVYGIMGSCVFQLPTAAMLGNWFDKRAGLAMGLTTAFASLCTAAFSPFFNACILAFGWRTTYLVQGIVVAAFTLPWTMFVLRLRPADVGALPYGYDPSESGQKLRSKDGGVPFKRALFSVSFLMIFLFAGIGAFVGSGFDSHLAAFAVSIGYSSTLGALLISALQLGSVADKLLMGFLNDRIGVQKTVYVEFVVVSLGLLGLAFLRDTWGIVIAAFLFGVQDSFTSVSLPLLLRKYFGRLEYERLYAWARVGSGAFGAFAAVLVGLSFDLTGSYVSAFLGALGLCVLGAIVVTIGSQLSKKLPWVASDSPLSGEEESNRKSCSELG